MWCVVINHAIPVDINIVALLKSNNGRKAVAALECVADLIGAITTGADNIVIQNITEISSESVECRVIQTNAQTAKLDERTVERRSGIHTITEIEPGFSKGRKRTKLRFGSRRCA